MRVFTKKKTSPSRNTAFTLARKSSVMLAGFFCTVIDDAIGVLMSRRMILPSTPTLYAMALTEALAFAEARSDGSMVTAQRPDDVASAGVIWFDPLSVNSPSIEPVMLTEIGPQPYFSFAAGGATALLALTLPCAPFFGKPPTALPRTK